MNTVPGLEKFLNWLLNHSLQAGLLVLLVLLVQLIFRRQLTNRWRFALWWIVLIRMILPFGPESAFSVFNICRSPVQLPSSTVALQEFNVAADTSDSPSAEAYQPNANIRGTDDGQQNQLRNFEQPQIKAQSGELWSQPPGSMESEPPIPARKPSGNLKQWLAPGLAAGWLFGVVALGSCVAYQLLRFRRRLGKITPSDSPLPSLLHTCQREFGVSRKIELLETDAVKSPALFGLFRLRLLLPKDLADQFTQSELRFIFLHELAHVKRGDLWLNWLVTAMQIVHWFNPLIWLGFARLRADRELACDELALLRAGEKVGTSYGETVIKLLEGVSRPAAVPGLIGILEDKKQMRRRISMIANFRTPSRWSSLAVLLLGIIAATTWTDAQTTKSAAPASTGLNSAAKVLTLPTLKLTNGPAGYFDTNRLESPEIDENIRGTVLMPNGEPAVGAQVAVGGQFLELDRTEMPPVIRTDSRFIAWTDLNGAFTLPQPTNAFQIVASHKQGFARAVGKGITTSFRLQLLPWAGVEGILRVNNHPGSNDWVYLWTSDPLNSGLGLRSFTDQADPTGRFSIDYVPTGNYIITRIVHTNDGIRLAHPLMELTLNPGQVTQVNVGGNGTRVVGKLSFPKPAEATTGFVAIATLERSRISPKNQLFGYPLVMNDNGDFTADDIPPGDYVVKLNLFEPNRDTPPVQKSIQAWTFSSAPGTVTVPNVYRIFPASTANLGIISLQSNGKPAGF